MTGAELESLVRDTMGPILSEYSLATTAPQDNMVLLRSDTAAFEIAATIDGVTMTFIDIVDPELRRYGVDYFLITKRPNHLIFPGNRRPTHNFKEYIASDLALLGLHLCHAGKDILSGDRKWLQERQPSNSYTTDDERAALFDATRFVAPPDTRRGV
jgi:hypothetical protein